MIIFIDDQGFVGKPAPGNATKASQLNALLEQTGRENFGHWQVIWEGLQYCQDCGKVGESRGHQDCQFPGD